MHALTAAVEAREGQRSASSLWTGLQMLVCREVLNEDLLSGPQWACPTPTMPFAFFAILFSSLFPTIFGAQSTGVHQIHYQM